MLPTVEKNSLKAAERIYNCPCICAPERKLSRPLNRQPMDKVQRTKKYLKSLTDRRKVAQGPIRPKKEEELPTYQRDRLHQLLNVYAEQSTKNYRSPARKGGALPPLHCRMKIGSKMSFSKSKDGYSLPKIHSETPLKKKVSAASKYGDVGLPNIIFE